MGDALMRWEMLRREVNGLPPLPPLFGSPGVRDPDFLCDEFDGRGYDGTGRCDSDGHYLCKECSQLSPEAPRFTQDRAGRGDRLRLFWARKAGNNG